MCFILSVGTVVYSFRFKLDKEILSHPIKKYVYYLYHRSHYHFKKIYIQWTELRSNQTKNSISLWPFLTFDLDKTLKKKTKNEKNLISIRNINTQLFCFSVSLKSFLGTIRTTFLAGSTTNITWHLAYAHRVSSVFISF